MKFVSLTVRLVTLLKALMVVKDLSIRLGKTFHDNLTNLANEFRLFKAEMQQQLPSLREHFLESQKGRHTSTKSSPNMGSGLTRIGACNSMGW